MPLNNVTFEHNFSEIPPSIDIDGKSNIRLTSYMQNDKRRISMPPKECSAVELRRLRYVVGRGRKAKTILSNINMTVPEGAIYGLLGPSGSGKTTLLKSVVGQLQPSEGWVKVFGFRPNTPGSQIPGPAIGYMPQELAVYEDFTIKETLWYFGRLYRVPSKVISERIEFLLNFLDLPRGKRLVINMSGGQKRRVSLASALVHSPPLLILDEPTVGVDPLLRQSIWQHLVTLTQTEKITVIVTTHYIEEARRANIVGLMRRGRLLAENTPDELMAKHNSDSLEDVFLKLCVTDSMQRTQKFAILNRNLSALAICAPGGGGGGREANSGVASPANANLVGNRSSTASPAPDVTSNSGKLSDSGASNSHDEGINSSASGSIKDSSTTQNKSSPQQILATADAAQSRDSSTIFIPSSTIETIPEAKTDQEQQQQQATHGTKKFQLKSILFKPFAAMQNNNQNKSTASGESAADNEKRRQSGSHYLEQLMIKYQEQQQQQQQQQPSPPMLDQPTSQIKEASEEESEQQRIKSPAPQDQQPNNVPRIEIVQQNQTTPAYSPHPVSGRPSPVLSERDQQQQQQQRQQNQLALSGFQNHTYQSSECGSVCNELALISASDLQKQMMNVAAAAANNNILLDGTKLLDQSTNDQINQNHHHHHNHNNHHLNHHHKSSMEDDNDENHFITNEVDGAAINPELFLNAQDLSTMSPGLKYDYKRTSVREYCDTIGTITWKNYIRLRRNVPLLLFQFLLPAIQVILFCICVGNDPFDIPVAVVNEETSHDSFMALSSQFLQSVDSKLVRQVNYNNLEEAIASVKQGKNWGVIHIPENFTNSIFKRFGHLNMGEDVVETIEEIDLENSTIKVYPDMTNQPIGHAMEVAFRRAYNELAKSTYAFFNMSLAHADPPIRMESAIYGKLDMQNYLQYMSPGVLISISYIMATGLTSLAFIIERRDGLFDRTLAAGADQIQMLISHSIVQLVVMIVQISLVVFFTFVIYKVPTNGPFVWVFALLLLQGLAGMSFGLMVSAICHEENTAIMMILGTFYPNLLLAGVIWPIEAIPYWLRWFSYLQPQTLPTQSLRDLIVRGWDIDQPGVYSGFAVTSIWLIVFLTISCISFKLKK